MNPRARSTPRSCTRNGRRADFTGSDTPDYVRDLAERWKASHAGTPQRSVHQRRDLIVVPEGTRASARLGGAVIAGVAAIGLVVGAVTTYTTLRNHLDARDAAIVVATDRAVAAEADAHEAAVQIGVLESRAADLRTVLDRSRARTVVVGASRVELRRQLARARRDLDRARAQIVATAETPTGDGRYIAKIEAVGPTQDPPVIALDLGRWLTGQRARQAAIADARSTPATSAARPIPAQREARLSDRAPRPDRARHRPRRHRRAGVSLISVEELQQAMRSTRSWAERTPARPLLGHRRRRSRDGAPRAALPRSAEGLRHRHRT